MMLQYTKWWSILTIIKVYLILYLIYKLLKFMKGYAQSLGILQPFSVPGINTQLLYPYLLISHYKKSTPECPALCAFFQTVIGFCHLYGKDGLFRGHILFKPAVIFFKAQAVEAVLSSTELIDKSREYSLMRPWIGNGLITSQGTKWRKQRKILTPTFHFSILDECIPIFQEQANVLISKIKSQIQEPCVDIVPLLSLCTLDIICQTAMGVSMNIQKGGNCDYSNAILEIEEAIIYRGLRPWLHPDIIFNWTSLGKKFNSNLRLVHELSKKVLKQKIDKITNKDYNLTFDNESNKYSFEKKMRKPFLELLLEYHLKDPSFTEEVVREEVDTFMFAGHDTTAAAISWVLYCLGIYPKVQRQVHEELDAIFGNEMDENISRQVLAKMKYLECVIKETLRLYPVVPVITRENTQVFKALNYTVKKGTLCVILFWELHRDPDIFPDPEKFNPERFLPENCAGRHPYAYAPFSAGPRNCIGQKFAMMETKTVLACILRHFRVKSLDPRDKVLIYPNITIRNAHSLRLSFECR